MGMSALFQGWSSEQNNSWINGIVLYITGQKLSHQMYTWVQYPNSCYDVANNPCTCYLSFTLNSDLLRKNSCCFFFPLEKGVTWRKKKWTVKSSVFFIPFFNAQSIGHKHRIITICLQHDEIHDFRVPASQSCACFVSGHNAVLSEKP